MAGNLNEDDINRLADAFNNLRTSTEGLAEEQKRISDATNAAAKSEKDYEKAMESAKQSLQAFGSGLHKSLGTAGGGLTKYSSAFSSLGDAAFTAGKQFGPLGTVIGGVVKAFTLVTESVMKQNDAIIAQYNNLGKFGATVGTSTKEVLDLGLKAGYSSKNLENFYKHTQTLGTGLVALGASASGGVKAMADIANVGKDARENFRALGFSQEEVTEMQADYVKQLTMTGGIQNKSVRQLRQESEQYVYTLTALAEMTGQTVKQQKEARDKAMAQENFNAHIFELERQRAATTDKAEQERLGAQIEATKALGAYIVNTKDAKTATAELQTIAMGQNIMYDSTNALLIQQGRNYKEINAALAAGKKPYEVIRMEQQQTADVIKRSNDTYGKNTIILGAAGRNLQQLSGATNEARKEAAEFAKYQNMSAEEKAKLDAQLTAEAIQQAAARKKAEDEGIQATNAQKEAEIAYQKAMDEMISLIRGPVLSGLTGFFNIISTTIKIVQGFVDALSKGFSALGSIFGLGSGPKGEATTGQVAEAIGSTGEVDLSGMGGGEAETTTSTPKPTKARKATTTKPAAPAKPATTAPATPMVSPGTNKEPVTTTTPTGTRTPATGTQQTEEQKTGKASPEELLIFGSRSGSKENFDSLSPDFRDRILAAAADYSSVTGKKLKINSAKRDTEDQQRIWDESVLAGRPGIGPTGMPIAKPGVSKHEQGFAVDIQNYADPAAIDALQKQGLFQTVKKDPVHFEIPKAANGGIFSGPKSGYPVTLHGTEAVLPDFKLPELIKSLNNVTKQELPSIVSTSNNDKLSDIIKDLMDMMGDKLDTVIDQLSESNNTQDKLLTYSKV
jgi:D-alanyl-D-alanine carboxypeptidase